MSSKYPNENLFGLLHFFPPHRRSLAWHKVNLFDAEQGRSVLSFSFYLKLQPCQSRHFVEMKKKKKGFFLFSRLYRNCPQTHVRISQNWLLSKVLIRIPGSGKHRFLQDAANRGLNTLVLGFVLGGKK